MVNGDDNWEKAKRRIRLQDIGTKLATFGIWAYSFIGAMLLFCGVWILGIACLVGAGVLWLLRRWEPSWLNLFYKDDDGRDD